MFHPPQNSFETSDEDEVDNNVNGIAVTQNQVPTTATSTATTAAAARTTTTTVAQRPNEVNLSLSCLLQGHHFSIRVFKISWQPPHFTVYSVKSTSHSELFGAQFSAWKHNTMLPVLYNKLVTQKRF